jgi:nitroreductase
MMYQLLQKRRSYRKFTEQAVEQEKIDQILRNALMSPAGKSLNPWEFIVVTNKRVVEIVQFKAFFVLNQGRCVKILTPGSIKEVGYTKEGQFCGCLCQSYNLFYESFTQKTSVLLSSVDSEDGAQKVVDAFYAGVFGAKM